MAGLRITTWNVNGIRNPFGYQPWREKRSFEAMFEILEADIVVMQETKIQRKDLRDDMVLVPGWDVYFSLPKHKKGYSGVAIYTRNSVCSPIRAEEGITGVLTSPNSTISFCDLPPEKQIGGYPSISQLAECPLDAAILDSEGRCVILEFPAFVLIGVYNPATRDESRDEFRMGFLNALDARVRNLIAAGKRVFLTGDLNIIREEIDSANAEEQIKKNGMTGEGYVSMPARRLFNQLLVGGKVIGARDEGREKPVLVDLCRSFHPNRKGMFTCWETKINARPGNFGSRIDYVLCSEGLQDWFMNADIQEGLFGSDHCPVFATMKSRLAIDQAEVDIKDIMNPAGVFKNGQRQKDWSTKDLLPTSARLIPEFDRRRNIRDMFQRAQSSGVLDTPSQVLEKKESRPKADSQFSESANDSYNKIMRHKQDCAAEDNPFPKASTVEGTSKQNGKRAADVPNVQEALKRSRPSISKSNISAPKHLVKGQSSLIGFFKPKSSTSPVVERPFVSKPDQPKPSAENVIVTHDALEPPLKISIPQKPFQLCDQPDVIDPIVSKESWSRLLGKRVVPHCEHDEPCVSFKTKKPGENCGRFFYMCSRPLGPSGQKEKNTQWRCSTFIWSSDWSGE